MGGGRGCFRKSKCPIFPIFLNFLEPAGILAVDIAKDPVDISVKVIC